MYLLFISNALVEMKISNRESHIDCQKGVLMHHCLLSDSASIMFHNQATESQLTARLRLTALQGHEAKGSFCPLLSNALRMDTAWNISLNCMQKQGRADWCQSPNVLDINAPSLKGINALTHSVSRPKGADLPSVRENSP